MEPPVQNTSHRYPCHVERSETSPAIAEGDRPPDKSEILLPQLRDQNDICDSLYDLT